MSMAGPTGRESVMKQTVKALLTTFGVLASALGVGVGTTPAHAQAKTITLCWAAWDPANALVELSKDFTAKTGVGMKFEFVPWTNYADRFLNELNSHGSLCDLIIGDSQWIGGAAENGQYVKLNDFFTKEGISMDDYMPATVVGYSEWPKNSPNYWALPAMGDAVGWTYRKDWFARPEIQADFKAKYGRDLAVPKTLDELRDIAKFFQGREIDGKKVYGASIYTERGSEGITMGVSNYLYDYGFQYQDPKKPYSMDGFVNSPGAVKGLEAYKELYKCCTPPGASNSYMSEGLDAFKSGQVALQMNFFAFFPGPLQRSERRWGQDRLLQQSRRPRDSGDAARRAGHLGRFLFQEPGRGAAIYQMVLRWRCAEEVVGARRLFLRQVSVERSGLPEQRAVCRRVFEVDGNGRRLLGRAFLCPTPASRTEARA
ncbi:ABC-type glycerol-3-phosphate transport system substrate-binding protein [Bradyrhizobium sp. i1.3.1]